MNALETKRSVYDSVERMLSPESMSDFAGRPVTRVAVAPINEHVGLAGGQLSYVDTNAGRFVLKRMSMDYDWIMYATDDNLGRSVKLWEYGIMDEISPLASHGIKATSRDGEGWALLMEDLTDRFFTTDTFPPKHIHVFLDTLARIHTAFWEDPRLRDPRLGLADSATPFHYDERSRNLNGNDYGELPSWFSVGWDELENFLDEAVYVQMRDLNENPAPLIDALDRYPSTLRHGDYRSENLGFTREPVVIDWQTASRSLMTIDLAWYVKQRCIQRVIPEGEVISYYRNRLEKYLDFRFDDRDWEAMVDLGFAVDALLSACLIAYWAKRDARPEDREYNIRLVKRMGGMVMNCLRWL